MGMEKWRRQKWKDAGYGGAMGSAEACLPPSPDFCRLYHFTGAGHAKTNIEYKRLKVSRFGDLNDPFELGAANLMDSDVRRVARQFAIDTGKATGIVCFSADWTSPLMWGHYAEKHQGICLGFDVRRSNNLKEVSYATTRLKVGVDAKFDPPVFDDAAADILKATKCSEWAYEREHRLFVNSASMVHVGSIPFYSLGPDLILREIILGRDCAEDLATLRALVAAHAPDAIVFQARLAWKHFKVVPKESTVP